MICLHIMSVTEILLKLQVKWSGPVEVDGDGRAGPLLVRRLHPGSGRRQVPLPAAGFYAGHFSVGMIHTHIYILYIYYIYIYAYVWMG